MKGCETLQKYFAQPSESIATGSVNSETIPRSFLWFSVAPVEALTCLFKSTKAKQCPNVPFVGKSTVNGKFHYLGPQEIDRDPEVTWCLDNPQKYTRKFLLQNIFRHIYIHGLET